MKKLLLIVSMLAMSTQALAVDINTDGRVDLSEAIFGTFLFPTMIVGATTEATAELSGGGQARKEAIIRVSSDAAAYQATGQKTALLDSVITVLRTENKDLNNASDDAIAAEILVQANELLQ